MWCEKKGSYEGGSKLKNWRGQRRSHLPKGNDVEFRLPLKSLPLPIEKSTDFSISSSSLRYLPTKRLVWLTWLNDFWCQSWFQGLFQSSAKSEESASDEPAISNRNNMTATL